MGRFQSNSGPQYHTSLHSSVGWHPQDPQMLSGSVV